MIEQVVLSHLVYNEAFARKTIPFLKKEYFDDVSQKIVFELIDEYINKYNAFPTSEALHIDLGNKSGLSEELYKNASGVIEQLKKEEDTNLDWLVDQAEEFCKEHSLHNALRESISIMGDKTKEKGMIPQLLTDALSISFDSDIGHDFIEDAQSRYDYYHKKEAKLPFDIDLLNKVTNGGIPDKTLNVILGGINVGKTLIMCHFASTYLMQGKNVLYITLEMSQDEIGKRIDANLMDIAMNDLSSMSQESFMRKVAFIKNKTQGKLKIKEYPTASAGAAHFRHLLNEYRIKKNFIPDVIFIDYINICTSTRFKGGMHNSYTIVKAIAEEFRGLAVEQNLRMWTATQLTRSGFSSSDVGLDDVSESFGLPAVADFMFAAIQTEQYEQLGQYMIKQLKNRYNHKSANKRFVVGVDTPHMRLYNVEEEAQEDSIEDSPVMDNSDVGARISDEVKSKIGKFNKSKFVEFK